MGFIWRALHDQPLIITGTGTETRDFIYVDDLVDGLIRAATIPRAHGQPFNLGTGIQTQIIDLAEMIIEACRSQSKIVFTSRRPWDKSTHRQADISRAQSTLDFEPTVTLNEGIIRTVAWFQENRELIASSREAHS
jgi:nucleoside-diphosphate-sugar epimerase